MVLLIIILCLVPAWTFVILHDIFVAVRGCKHHWVEMERHFPGKVGCTGCGELRDKDKVKKYLTEKEMWANTKQMDRYDAYRMIYGPKTR
jgi:hypothetical protein